MKRSEAVQLIKKFIKDNNIHGKFINDEESSLLLAELEKVGMAPPKYSRPMDWNEKEMTYSDWIQLPSKIREWESE